LKPALFIGSAFFKCQKIKTETSKFLLSKKLHSFKGTQLVNSLIAKEQLHFYLATQ